MSEYQPSEMRISDAEREDALTKLGEHMSTGRLDINEFGERSAKVAAAKTRGELLGLFGDLPEPRPVFGQPARGSAIQPRERTFAERVGPVAIPVAAIAIVAVVFVVFKIWFFLPFLFIFLMVNRWHGDRNGRGRDGRGRMRHGRGW